MLDALADKWTKEHQGEFSRLAPAPTHGLQAYVQGSENINTLLRHGKLAYMPSPANEKKVRTWISEIDDAFAEAAVPLSQDVVVMRGVLPRGKLGVSPEGFDPATFYAPGKVVTDKGFMSTTSNATVASRFTGRKNEGGNWVMDVEVPKGTRVIPTNNIRGEHEILLNRGTSYEVLSVDQAKRRVRVRVLDSPGGTPPSKPSANLSAPLTKDEVQSVKDYVESGSFLPINGYLRGIDVSNQAVLDNSGFGGTPEELAGWAKQEIGSIDSAVGKSALTAPVTVYRSFDGSSIGDKTQGTFVDPGYASTTTNKAVADQWGGNAVMAINVPAGRHGLWIDGIGDLAYMKQNELLLGRGNRYSITSVETLPDGRKQFNVDLIGEGPA